MTRIEYLLKAHAIRVRREGEKLYAFDVVHDIHGRDLSQWVDVTGMTVRQVYDFLNY